MKNDVKVVLFDLGNTLIHDETASWTDVYLRADRSLWSSLRKFGVNTSTHELFGDHKTLLDYYYELREGDLDEPGIGTVLRDLLNEHKIQLSDEKLQSALRSMYAVTQTNWFLEDDAIPTLQVLLKNSYRLGIISNGSDDLNTYELLEKARLRSFFEFILSSAAFGKRKPHPGIFRAALDHFQIPPELTVMVGDNYEADILGARQLGINTIWVTRRLPFPPGDPRIQEEKVVSKLSEIPALLKSQ
jgi:HAD superfamily hydrolase (TIGR01549 family)